MELFVPDELDILYVGFYSPFLPNNLFIMIKAFINSLITKSSLQFTAIVLLSAAALTGCQSHGTKDHKSEIVKGTQVLIPKDTLLNCISEVVKITAEKGYDFEKVREVFEKRGDRYKVVVYPKKDFDHSDLEVLLVSDLTKPKEPSNFTLYIPAVLQKQLLFPDLKSRFGNWIIANDNGAPEVKSPLTRFDIAENGKSTVHLTALSTDVPKATQNMIISINISK